MVCTQQLLTNNINIYRDYIDSNLKSYILVVAMATHIIIRYVVYSKALSIDDLALAVCCYFFYVMTDS